MYFPRFTLSLMVLALVTASSCKPYQINTCHSCEGIQLSYFSHRQLKSYLQWKFNMEYSVVRSAFAATKAKYTSEELDSSMVDVTEYCGSPLHISEDDMKVSSIQDLVADVMVNLNDVIVLNKSPSNLHVSLERLNNTMCVVKQLEVPSGCMRSSHLATCNCSSDVSGHSQGFTCELKMTLRFLKNAREKLRYLKNNIWKL